jgi:hypothetical protein
MSRVAPVLLFSTALCLMASIQTKSVAQTAPGIPAYFFSDWTVNRDCTEAHAGAGSGHTRPGQEFRVIRSTSDGTTYKLQPVNKPNLAWSSDWSNVRLEYRAGTRMGGIPADLECVPGQEAGSPFLAMSGYSQSAEPYYGYEHWYGLVTIHGERHHLLIFPRNTQGPSSAAVVLIDVDASGNLQLDHNGTIVVEN